MERYLHLIFAPLFASFGCFIAFDYFATPALHGIINGEVLIFLLIWILPRKSKIKFFLLFLGLATTIFFNPVVGACILYAVAFSFVGRNSIWPSILPTGLFFLFSIVADCLLFFNKTFLMDLPQIWEVCSYFWWGAILFFVVPLGFTATILFFSRKVLWKKNRLIINPAVSFVVILSCLFANIGFACIQNRMTLVDFPIYNFFWDYNIHKSFDNTIGPSQIKNDSLSEETKAAFKIWDSQTFSTIGKKTVFVLVESYGVNKDTTIAKQMIYEPFTGANPSFIGILPRQSMHTQGAELEDLGNVSSRDTTEIALLASLKKEKIETWFLHGYTGDFYSRREKYKQLGFDSLLFIDEIRERNAKICRYGFEGICDSSMINVIDSILYRPGDKFIYWTTLDSHPPYKENLILPNYSVFCKNLSVAEKECMYYSLIENTLKRIVALAQRHPDYQFVIRGDHRPMATINPDNYYFAWVPMIVLN